MILEARNIGFNYDKKEVLKDVNLSIDKGEIAVIIGPNGCGKSTLLKILIRCLKPNKGEIFLEGKDIKKIKNNEVAKKLAMLPQAKNIPSDVIVETLVGYGRFPHLGFNKRLKKEDYDIVDWAIEKTGLQDLKNRTVGTLSGGERQRAWIAMALAQKTDILILDEPTTFLDISYQLDILQLIKQLNEELGLTIIMVLHDLNLATRYAHKIYAMKDGLIYKQGKYDETIDNLLLKDVFNIKASFFDDEINGCPFLIPQQIIKK